MRIDPSLLRGIAVVVIALLVALAFAPSINANVSKEEKLVEVTTEFCGLGKKYTIYLTQEQLDEVDKLFDGIKLKLDNVESTEETLAIYNEAVVKFNKYGFLRDLSTKQVNRLNKLLVNAGIINRLYFINGKIGGSYSCFRTLATSLNKHPLTGILGFTYEALSSLLLGLTLWRIPFIPSVLLDFSFGHREQWYPSSQWHYYSGNGEISAYGPGTSQTNYSGKLWGTLSKNSYASAMMNGEEYVGIRGFSGIRIFLKDSGYILGYALELGLSNACPDQ